MGSNSTDALEAFMEEYMSRCSVVGGRIITPGQKEKKPVFDPTGGGHRLPTAPQVGDECVVCGEKGSHRGLPCPYLKAYSLTGKPDWKRGQ